MNWFFSMSADIETSGDDVLSVCMALKKTITGMLSFKDKTRKALRKQEICLYNVLMVQDKKEICPLLLINLDDAFAPQSNNELLQSWDFQYP